MRLRVVLLVPLLALAAHSAAQPAGLDLTFQPPAGFHGTADASVDWVALVLSPEDAARATAALGPGAVLVNHTHLQTTLRDPVTGSTVADERALPPERHPLDQATTMRVTGPTDWTAVLLTGGLRLTVETTEGGTLAWGELGDAWTRVAGPRDHPAAVARPDARVLPLTGGYIAASGDVTVSGDLAAMEWLTLEATCTGDGAPCADAPAPATPGTTARTYHRLEGDGTIAWNGTAHRVLAGSGGLDALLDGTLRLPLARSDGDCPGCVGWHDRTLALDGVVHVQDLRRTDGDRLRATLTGDVRAAFLDEAPAVPGSLGLRAAAGVAVVGVGIGALALLVLRAAMSPELALRNDSRRTIHETISDRPGISFRDVQRSTGLGNGNIVYHLGVLEAAGVLRSRRHQNQVHYFLPEHFDGDAWRAEVTLAKPGMRRMHGLVASLNTPTQGELVAATEAWGWSRAVTQKRLRKLEDVGLVRVLTSGRFRHYVAVPHRGVPFGIAHPSPQPAAASA